MDNKLVLILKLINNIVRAHGDVSVFGGVDRKSVV